VRDVLHADNDRTARSDILIYNDFATYFNDMVMKLKSSISVALPNSPLCLADPVTDLITFRCLDTVSCSEVSKIISSMTAKSLPQDYIPSSIIEFRSRDSYPGTHFLTPGFSQFTVFVYFKQKSDSVAYLRTELQHAGEVTARI
jgi:hypothetical protein